MGREGDRPNRFRRSTQSQGHGPRSFSASASYSGEPTTRMRSGGAPFSISPSFQVSLTAKISSAPPVPIKPVCRRPCAIFSKNFRNPRRGKPAVRYAGSIGMKVPSTIRTLGMPRWRAILMNNRNTTAVSPAVMMTFGRSIAARSARTWRASFRVRSVVRTNLPGRARARKRSGFGGPRSGGTIA